MRTTILALAFSLGLVAGCGRKLLHEDNQMSVYQPTSADLAQLQNWRARAIATISATTGVKDIKEPIPLPLLQKAIDAAGPATPPEIVYGYGVIIGDRFVSEHKMQWLVVKTSHGTDLVVMVPRTLYSVGAVTLVIKRVEAQEKFDAEFVYRQIEEHMLQHIGEYQKY